MWSARRGKCERLGGAAKSAARLVWRQVYTESGPEDSLPHALLPLTSVAGTLISPLYLCCCREVLFSFRSSLDAQVTYT